MPKKRRRKGEPHDDAEDFQMMDIDFNPPSTSSVPIAPSTSTLINVSHWDISGDRILGTSSLSSIEDRMAVTASSATDSTTRAAVDDIEVESTTQATSDYIDVESTFHNVDPDEDTTPEHDRSGKRSFLGVSDFFLSSIIEVLIHVLFIS